MAGSAAVSMMGLNRNMIAVIAIPLALIILCMIVQFIMRSRQVGRRQEEKADEKRQQISRETEVEKARKLLEEDYAEDDEPEDEFEEDYEYEEDSEDDFDEPEASLDTELEEDRFYVSKYMRELL